MIWHWILPSLVLVAMPAVLVSPMYVPGTTHQVSWYHNPAPLLLLEAESTSGVYRSLFQSEINILNIKALKVKYSILNAERSIDGRMNILNTKCKILNIEYNILNTE